MSYLAFDLGGSGGKLFLGCLRDGTLALEEVHRFGNAPVSVGPGLYWSLFGIYEQLNTGLRLAAHRAGGDPIVSLGLDSFSNDFSLIDGNGEVLIPMRCYRDGRTERHAEEAYRIMPRERLHHITGNQNAPFNTLMQLAAMRCAGQGYLLEKAGKLLFTPDLLAFFLTGEAVAEFTIASVSQMMDLASGTWSDEILRAYGIPARLLAPIVEPGTTVGGLRKAYREEHSLPDFRVVAVCEHDTASAFLSSVAEGERVIISCGTWSLVGTEADAPVINDATFTHNIANEGGYRGRVRILRNVMGLWIIQQIRRDYAAMGENLSFGHMGRAAAEAKPFAFLFDPDDPGLFAPENMLTAVRERCGDKSGRKPETLGEIVRAVEESLAFKYRWAIEKIEAAVGKKLPVINIVGGGSQDDLLCRFTANACGRPVLAGPTEATALGNVMVQLLADGALSSLEEGRRLVAASFPPVWYQPEDTVLWNERYGEFRSVLNLK